MKIKIKKIPEGEAPKEIREKWVGCELPVLGFPKLALSQENLSRKPRHKKCFAVCALSALAILRGKSPEAARWFEENVKPPIDSIDRYFFFNEKECKIIDYEII